MNSADSLEKLLSVLLAPGMPSLNDQVYGYLAPLNRPLFENRRRRLKRVMAMKVSGAKNRGRKGRLVGVLFERLIMAMLDGCNAMSYKANLRSTTSEIDFLIAVLPTGLAVPFLREAGTHILGEAKNYGKGPKHEWVNELVGLMASHSTCVGILFFGCKPRKLAREVRTAIALHVQKNMTVVPIGETHIEQVANGASFLRLLSEQYAAARAHAGLEI